MSNSAVANQQFLSDAPPGQKVQEGTGQQRHMIPQPVIDTLFDGSKYKAAGKLAGKKALITGGDSGIGGSTALLFAMEGADLTISFLPEEEKDMELIKQKISEHAPKCKLVTVATDLTSESNCIDLVNKHMAEHGALDVVILNHGTQHVVEDVKNISTEQWMNTFNVNIHPHFFISREALKHLRPGGSISMNASVNTFKGHPTLVDYTATKGAILGFTRALAQQLSKEERGIRVNAVAPGPIWTPLITSSMSEDHQSKFGTSVPMGRAGQPIEVATCFVFLSNSDAGYITGQVLHPNGGTSY